MLPQREADRQGRFGDKFFFFLPCFFFPFFPPLLFPRPPRSFGSRSSYPRISSSSSGKYARGRGGDASTELSTLEDARRLYRRVGSSWQGACVWSSSRFVGSIVNCICFLYARFHPSPPPSPPPSTPVTRYRRARGTESPLFCRFNVAYCRISPRMPSFPVPFPSPRSFFIQPSPLPPFDPWYNNYTHELSAPILFNPLHLDRVKGTPFLLLFFFFFFCSIVSPETKTIDERTRELVRFVSFRFSSSISVRISKWYKVGLRIAGFLWFFAGRNFKFCFYFKLGNFFIL